MAALKDRFINALLGEPVQGQYSSPSVGYGSEIDNYLNTLDKQQYMQQLLNQPKETRLSLEQYKKGIANGLNYGVPEIANAQEQLGIRIPKTDEEKELAILGQFNKPSQLNIGASNDIRKGGFINDLVGGYKENYNQGFDINNLEPRNRSFATRFGEGLGTIGRFADSPLGRGLIAYGLSNAVGDTNPLEQAITAGVGRQGNIARNKVYSEALRNMGYENNLIGGYNYTDDILKNLADIKQLQENAEYRKLYLENQRIQNELMNQYRQDQLKAQELERAAQREDRAATRALTARGQNLNYDVAMRKLEADANKETAAERKEKAKLKQAQNTINMISKAKETVQNNPNAFGYVQGALGADVSNRLFKGGTQARSTINSVAAEYRKYLTGAQMSDRERLDYEKFLPSPKDNAKIINDKLNAMLDVISAREGIETTSNGVTNVGNYKVRVKK